MPDNLTYWPDHLAEHEARVAPPFCPGDRVVHTVTPLFGSSVVEQCVESVRGGWRLIFRDGSAMADDFALAPVGWREPPPLPASRGEFTRTGWRELDETREPEWQRARAAQYRALATWLREVWSLIDPEYAEEQAAGMDSIADELVATEAFARIGD